MPKQDGRNMIMVLGPTKKKADQRNEQRRAAAAQAQHDEPQDVPAAARPAAGDGKRRHESSPSE